MLFKEIPLDERLLRAAAEAGYETPTPIQEQAIPICMEGSDLIGTAATGTGKTAAFVLPLLNRILQKPVTHRNTRAIIVTPTRELAEQIQQVIRKLAKHTRIRSACVYGGVGFEPQRRALSDGTEIIVCCPGRMLDHMEKCNCRLLNVEIAILDEADRMLDMGFLPNIKQILCALPKERQTMLFSATFAPELLTLIKHELKHPKRVSVAMEAPAETVDHCFYPVANHLKTDLLIALLKGMESQSVLVFTRTKHRANRVMEKLSQAGYSAGALHANKSQSQRAHALDGFRSGRLKLLVATDIAARGLDIDSISHVINFDIPDTATTYIHRIGRTGRAERSGDAITFISDQDMAEVRDIERRLGSPVEKKKLAGFDYHQARKPDEFSHPPRFGSYSGRDGNSNDHGDGGFRGGCYGRNGGAARSTTSRRRSFARPHAQRGSAR